jgi:hypothetical protein
MRFASCDDVDDDGMKQEINIFLSTIFLSSSVAARRIL